MPVTVQSRRERHKAELRSELVAAAHALVKDEGYEGLTIRKLAKRVGYAPMSVYSYFADKQDILLALAEDVFEQLARRAERNLPEEPLAALRHGMREFAAFGLENPNEYRIIFMTQKPQPADPEMAAELEKKNPALLSMRKCVMACLEAGLLKGDEHAITTFLWTTTHGAISAVINFPQYSFGPGQDYADAVIELALAAIRSREVQPLSGPAALC
ncbi:TetR/AcrR family transcriptional regulator [Mesorhizobium sp. ZC-5]|uniref:TetR/AcrR family transcriptional regulator n=1 Tax=Mesorhizobium sp. ZC-5 TaxID=2986066 RepID=UPI0021E77B3F|nr:TetR/AcrR family transcriptional regulator [Mesorhizobium sp. ZC-5]MCV3243006.1 TetR/AcrR family transcriptional regulator [Mesorhizobium sp. ZC-5]